MVNNYIDTTIDSYHNDAYSKLKICYIMDLFNGEGLAKDGKYKLEASLTIGNNFYFKSDKFLEDYREFINNCLLYEEKYMRSVV